MTILGLDPGIARTGFGVVQQASDPSFVRCGCLTTPAGMSDSERLHILGQDLTELITSVRPTRAIVESVFFGNNAKTAMQTAEARGVLIYILRQHGTPVHSLTPLQIKSRLTGYGAADKQQVQTVVMKRLGLTAAPEPDDAADALAAALCVADEQHSLSLN